MIVDKGILNYIDGISIHPYDYSSPDKTNKIETFSIIDKQYNQWKNKTGKVTKIYITEFGYSTYDGKFHYTEQQVKDTLSLYFAEAKSILILMVFGTMNLSIRAEIETILSQTTDC
ncbi:hypothetical protein [Klebsiella pneumoniae]|uniref:hypothetical protein n=1 Tax=Klebsiella pneumoniae TaxID=573 RepID=UPI0019106233|nr:hypothetical protein [Klebsiella pneumoniae]